MPEDQPLVYIDGFGHAEYDWEWGDVVTPPRRLIDWLAPVAEEAIRQAGDGQSGPNPARDRLVAALIAVDLIDRWDPDSYLDDDDVSLGLLHATVRDIRRRLVDGRDDVDFWMGVWTDTGAADRS